VGALAIQGSLKGPGTVLLAASLAVWAIPVFDVLAAILRRKLTGRSIYTTDCGHLHHRLLARLGSSRKVLVCLAIACTLTSAAALASVFFKNDTIALITCAAIVAVFIMTGLFGRVEFSLLVSRFRHVGLSLLPNSAWRRGQVSQTAVRLQGSRQWQLLWETLTEAAEKLSLSRISLDVNVPMAGEAYNAVWERGTLDELERCWRLELPLLVDSLSIGRLTIFGKRNGEYACPDIGNLLELLEPFEVQLHSVANGDLLTVPAERALSTVPDHETTSDLAREQELAK